MLRVIQEIRPAWVVGENVVGIVSMALDTVLSDLENIGYTCQAIVIPACAVDAPHRRDRVAIVAHADRERQQGRKQHGTPCDREPRCAVGKLCEADTDCYNRSRNVRRECELSAVKGNGRSRCNFCGGTPEHGGWEWWPAEPSVGRVANGIPSRVDKLKCLGNAVVPQKFFPIFEAIAKIEMGDLLEE